MYIDPYLLIYLHSLFIRHLDRKLNRHINNKKANRVRRFFYNPFSYLLKLRGRHLSAALGSGSQEIVNSIFKRLPNDFSVDGTHLSAAISSGNQEMVNWVYQKLPEDFSVDTGHLSAALGSGKQEMVNWVFQKLPEDFRVDASHLSAALGSGKQEIVNWLYQKLPYVFRPLGTINQNHLIAALGIGNMEMVKWVSRNLPGDVNVDEAHLSAALGSGKMEMVKWVSENLPEDNLNVDETHLPIALGSGNQEIANWVFQNLPEDNLNVDETHLSAAFASDNMEMANWVAKKLPDNFKWDKKHFYEAVKQGNNVLAERIYTEWTSNNKNRFKNFIRRIPILKNKIPFDLSNKKVKDFIKHMNSKENLAVVGSFDYYKLKKLSSIEYDKALEPTKADKVQSAKATLNAIDAFNVVSEHHFGGNPNKTKKPNNLRVPTI